MNENQRKRLQEEILCSQCNICKSRADFTDTQRRYGKAAKCRQCVHELELAAQCRTVECRICGETKVKDAFSKTQQDKPKTEGSKCKSCCDEALAATQTAFKEKYVQKKPRNPEQLMSKENAGRWVMEAPESALPSTDVKSSLAMVALENRSAELRRGFMPDTSGISVLKKIAMLKTTHNDLSHLGGARGLVEALRQEGQQWTNMERDAQWIINLSALVLDKG